MTTNPLTVVLLALTGFGNTVLEALLADRRVRVAAVVTHRYDGPFPYYEERQLIDLCGARGVTCLPDLKVGTDDAIAQLRAMAPDLMLVATFKQILGPPVLAIPGRGVVNLHPSLLPRHRGPCPTQAALLDDDPVSGVTAHYVTPRPDDGAILLQREVPIADVENDGELRARLATLAGEMVPDLIGMLSGEAPPARTPQDHGRATYAPRPAVEDGYLERLATVEAVRRAVRALNPVPGTSVAVDGARVAVDRCIVLAGPGPDRPPAAAGAMDLVIGGTTIRLSKAPERRSAGMPRGTAAPATR